MPDWYRYPPIELPSPGLAVLTGPGGVWVGGLGGVAWYAEAGGWAPPVGPALRSVAALAGGAGCLLAGGTGEIARSTDRGRTWRSCSVPAGVGVVTAIACAPAFAVDGVALAGTLAAGVLRSTDAGRSWLSSGFGVPSPEVLALAWGRGETVVAATGAGLARSPNGGRAWRGCAETEGTAFVALATLADGAILAAPEVGPPLRSTADLASWSPLNGLPDDIRTSALLTLADGRVLLASADHGLLSSADGGATWSPVAPEPALCLAADDRRVYAGTKTGLALSDDGGRTWREAPPAPLHDLHRLLLVDGVPLVAGHSSPPVLLRPEGGWTVLASAPLPLVGPFLAPDRTLLASTPDGLFRSADLGVSWQPVVAGEGGCVMQMTVLPDGAGWAGLTPDGALLRTRDGGRSWERLPAPFGVLPLVALQAMPGATGERSAALLAATYDDRRRAVALWRSDDGGEHWRRGGETDTPWPVVATGGAPPLVAIGNVVTVRQPDGTWRQTAVGETGIRRIVADGTTLVALTGNGVWRSDGLGETWMRADAGLPPDAIVDVGLDAGVVFVLLTGGRLWSRPLATAVT